MLTLKMGPNIL